jgi:Flp pilus assembly protein TadB
MAVRAGKGAIRLLTAFGVTQSAAAWAAQVGINPRTIYQRLRLGLSPEQAVSAFRTDAKVFTAFGFSGTLIEWSSKTGISLSKLRSRLRFGWPVERAFTQMVTVLES